MSDELQYGQSVLVYGCEDEPAYLARFWRGCGEPDRVWVVVFEQGRSPYPKLVLRERVDNCPAPDDLGDMPAWAWRDVAGTGRLEENLRLMTEAVRGQPWRGLEFDLRNQFHAFQYSTIVLISQALKGEVSASSPG